MDARIPERHDAVARRDFRLRLASAAIASVLVAVGTAPKRRKPESSQPTARPKRPGPLGLAGELWTRISDDRVLAISAGVTFYTLLAVFPAVASAVSIYGLFADPATINRELHSLSAVLPGGVITVVGHEIRRVASSSHGTLTLTAGLGVLISLWSANAGMKSLFDALNIVHREPERRSFVRLNAISLTFTIGALAALLAAISLTVWLAQLPIFSIQAVSRVAIIGGGVAFFVLLTYAIALIFHYGPSRNHIPWRWLSWGSVFAAVGWGIASVLFSFYAANFGTFDETYGSLGAAIGMMLWIWISAIVVLTGEEINEMIDTYRDPAKAREKQHPLGAVRRKQHWKA